MRTRRQATSLPATEGVHPDAADLDLWSIDETVRRLHREDRSVLRAVARVLPKIAQASRAAARALKAGGRLIYVGAGSSGRLGMMDAAECAPTFGANAREVRAVLAGGARAMAYPKEGAEDGAAAGRKALARLGVSSKDFVCGISASAKTPYVLAALAEARRRGAVTALVCCSVTPEARGAADLLIAAQTGPELIAGSTRLKAGTATKLILNSLSTAAFTSLGRVYRGRMVALKPASEKLRQRAERSVSELAGVSARRAKRLLRRAKGDVGLALAMHFTGLAPPSARRALRSHGLRRLEMLASRSRRATVRA